MFLPKFKSVSEPSLFPNDCLHEEPWEAIFSLGFANSSLGFVRSFRFSLLDPSFIKWSSSLNSAILSPLEIGKGEASSPLSIVKMSSNVSSRRSWSDTEPGGLKTQYTFILEVKRIAAISRAYNRISFNCAQRGKKARNATKKNKPKNSDEMTKELCVTCESFPYRESSLYVITSLLRPVAVF